MPAKPRWLLAVPDAIGQLEELERELLTRRDLERLFGVSRARAATLMRLFGAELTGYALTLPRVELLRQRRTYRKRGVFRAEEQRRARLLTELRKARLTGIRVPVPAEALQARLSGLPAGVLDRRLRVALRRFGRMLFQFEAPARADGRTTLAGRVMHGVETGGYWDQA